MYCAYHGLDHSEDTPFSPEHVIPYALGGSNQFTIQVCKKINSDIGTQIDARFQSIFPVAYERFIRNIRSYSGEEPSILFCGTTEFGGQRVKINYEITQEDKNLLLVPFVQSKRTKEGIRYTVRTTPAHFQKMLRDIERKYPGKSVTDESGNVCTAAELLARVEVQRAVPTIEVTWDPEEWRIASSREFVKVALGTAHFLLGERYSRSDAASQLRTFLCARDDELSSIPIHGNTWPFQVVPNLGVLYHGTKPDQHLVALLHMDDGLTVLVSLFGEMRGIIQIADDPTICQYVKPNGGFILTIDPMTRAFTSRSFEEFLKSFP
jgi:hypothetical protein